MKEFDDTSIEELPGNEARLMALEVLITQMMTQIRSMEAQIAELDATGTARRLQMVTEDPEWY